MHKNTLQNAGNGFKKILAIFQNFPGEHAPETPRGASRADSGPPPPQENF